MQVSSDRYRSRVRRDSASTSSMRNRAASQVLEDGRVGAREGARCDPRQHRGGLAVAGKRDAGERAVHRRFEVVDEGRSDERRPARAASTAGVSDLPILPLRLYRILNILSRRLSVPDPGRAGSRLRIAELAIPAALAGLVGVLYSGVLRLWWTYDDFYAIHLLKIEPRFAYWLRSDAWSQTHMFTPLLLSSFELDAILAGLTPRAFYVHQLVALGAAAVAALRRPAPVAPALLGGRRRRPLPRGSAHGQLGGRNPRPSLHRRTRRRPGLPRALHGRPSPERPAARRALRPRVPDRDAGQGGLRAADRAAGRAARRNRRRRIAWLCRAHLPALAIYVAWRSGRAREPSSEAMAGP